MTWLIVVLVALALAGALWRMWRHVMPDDVGAGDARVLAVRTLGA